MALINQQGMYNGSAPLNPLPYVNIAMQARARKQAREDALDKYYRDLPNTINDKGIRDTEVPIIEGIKKEIFEYGIKNREALRRGDGAAKLGLDQLFRKGQSVARLSQDAAKNKLESGKFFLNKDNQYALNSDEYVADLAAAELPVTDQKYKGIDLQKYATNRPFDQSGFIKEIKTVIPFSEKVTKVTDPTDPYSEIVTTSPVLDNAAKEKIVDYAANKYHNDPLFAKKISNDLAGTGLLPRLVEIAKDEFGVKDESELTDEILAAAYTYSLLPASKSKEKIQGNWSARKDRAMEDWITKNGITYQQSLNKIAANQQGQEILNGASGNSLDEFGAVKPIFLQSGGVIDKGIVFSKDGSLYNGEIVVKKEELPANVTISLGAGKIETSKFMNLIVKDGVIQSIKTKNGEVTRQAMENLQKSVDKEPLKASKLQFGNTVTPNTGSGFNLNATDRKKKN